MAVRADDREVVMDVIPCPHCGSVGPEQCSCVGAVVGRPTVDELLEEVVKAAREHARNCCGCCYGVLGLEESLAALDKARK